MTDRLKKIKELLSQKSIDGFFVSSYYDIAYFTGYLDFTPDERDAYLLITQDSQYIFTSGLYSEAVEKEINNFKLIEFGTKPFKESLTDLIKLENIQKLGVDENDLKVTEFKFLKKIFKKLTNFNTEDLRAIKETDEIKFIEKACEIGDETFKHILGILKAGVSEKEIADEIERFIKHKNSKISFASRVAFGKNSSVPHHEPDGTKLKLNSIVLLDLGARFNNYCSDMTRTFFYGKATEKQKLIYQTVLQSQQKAVEEIVKKIKNKKPIKSLEVDKVAREYIISKGYPSIPHSLGHGVGHEIHERPWVSPRTKEILKPGMVFSIEPGIYIPGFGGVRIEDLYVLEENNLRQITKSPKEILEIK